MVRGSQVDNDPILSSTDNRSNFEFAKADGGYTVACVPARLTGRCARPNHSQQETKGGNTPMADISGTCTEQQRNHGVRTVVD
jgi:hypothetical protein